MTPNTPRAAVPAQPEALRLANDLEASRHFPGNMRSCNNAAAAELRRLHAQVAALTAAQPTHEQIAAYLEATGAYVTNDASREAAIADAIAADRASQGAAERAVPADAADANWEQLRSALAMVMLGWGSNPNQTMEACYAVLDSVTEPGTALALLRVAPDWRDFMAAQRSAQNEHVSSDVSKNGRESNMTGGAHAAWGAFERLASNLGPDVDDADKAGLVTIRDCLMRAARVGRYRASHAQALAGVPFTHVTDDCTDVGLLWAEIQHLRAAIQGPDGYPSWQAAATAERIRRVKAERELRRPAPSATAQAAPAAGAVAGPSYGATEFGWTYVHRTLTDGDKRLLALVVNLFGNDHQAFNDLEALIDRAPTPAAQADSGVQEDAARMDWLETTHQRGHYCGVFSGNLLTRKSIDAARAALAAKGDSNG